MPIPLVEHARLGRSYSDTVVLGPAVAASAAPAIRDGSNRSVVRVRLSIALPGLDPIKEPWVHACPFGQEAGDLIRIKP